MIVRAAVLAAVTLAPTVTLAATPAEEAAAKVRQERALAIFKEGEAQFAAHSYDAAARLFLEAYENYPDPAYLFNVALAFEKAERWPLTVQYLERLLERFPDLPQRSDVERRLEAARASRDGARAVIDVVTYPDGATAVLKSDETQPACTTPCVLRSDPGPTTVELTLGGASRVLTRSLGPSGRWDIREPLELIEPPQPVYDRTGSVVAWGVGGAALITGVVFGVMASDAHSEGKALAAMEPLGPTDYDRLQGLRADVDRDSTIADVGFGVAIAGAIVGTVLWFTAEPEAPQVSGSRDGTGVVSWRF